MRRIFVFICASLAVMLTAGAVGAQTSTNSANTNGANGDSPDLTIVGPQSGDAVSGDQVTVSFTTSDFTLADYTVAEGTVAGEGHVHLWLDEDAPTSQNAVMVSAEEPYTFYDIASGTHTLRAELVDNAHGSLNPVVVRTVTFTSTAANPVATISTTSSTGRTANLTALNTILLVAILVILAVIAMTFWWYIMENETQGTRSTPQKKK